MEKWEAEKNLKTTIIITQNLTSLITISPRNGARPTPRSVHTQTLEKCGAGAQI